MKFPVLASYASEHRSAFADINQQRRTDVEGSPAAQRRSHHHCHVKDAQDVLRARIFQIIVGRFVFQLEVNEVLRRAEKCRRNQ